MTRLTPTEAPSAQVLSALSIALDMAEGQPMGHALRSCLLGLSIGQRAGLTAPDLDELFFALLLKDVGCSSNAAQLHAMFGSNDLESKRRFKRVDWSRLASTARYAFGRIEPGPDWFRRVLGLALAARDGHATTRQVIQIRCARGAEVVERLGFGARVAAGVRALDEHWDGGGQPESLRGEQIPVFARIMGLAQTIDVFASSDGAARALHVARARRGRWFDPALVHVAESLEEEIDGLRLMDLDALQEAATRLAPPEGARGPTTMDEIARAFAEVIDAKSPYTAQHSERMAEIAVRIGAILDLSSREQRDLHHAGLLHDIGKLSVPNTILDKPGKLTPPEWEVVRLHPYYTQRILERIDGCAELAFVASSHHERMDGRGYHRGLPGPQIPQAARILAVADVFEALTARRPYRDGLATETVLSIMERDRCTAFDADCLDALRQTLDAGALPAAA